MPNRLDKTLVIRYVRFVQIDPESDSLGQVFPFGNVPEDAFLAQLNERLNSVFDNLLFGFDAQLFADFALNGKSVGVPARFASAEEPLHRLIAREKVFNCTGEAVPRVRMPVRCRRTFKEDERRRIFPKFQRLFINAVFVPPLYQRFFLFRKRRFIDWLKHVLFSYCLYLGNFIQNTLRVYYI